MNTYILTCEHCDGSFESRNPDRAICNDCENAIATGWAEWWEDLPHDQQVELAEQYAGSMH